MNATAAGTGARWERLVVWAYTRTPDRLRTAVVRALAPTYTVGVLAVVRRPDGRVLLVDQPYRRGWSLPGGDLKRGESAARGAARELLEEVGLRVTVAEPTLAHQRLHDRWVTFVVILQVDDATADGVAPTSPELTAARWFSPSALPDLDSDAVAPLRVAGIGA